MGATTTLSATFADPGTGETHTALVNWGDGTSSSATVAESGGAGTIGASHVYRLHGSYQPTLSVTDSGGATALVPFAATVHYVAPTLSATTDAANVTAGQPATLTLHDGGPEDASAISGWRVVWGDGTAPQTITAPPDTTDPAGATWTVTHVYAAAGPYAALATATDSAGDHTAAAVTFTATAPALAGPSDLTATGLDDEDVELTWTPNPSDANTQFEVDRQNADGGWATLDMVDDTDNGEVYDDFGLSGATAYTYRLRSVGATTDSAYSVAVTVTTPLTAPDQPSDLSDSESVPGQIDLAWDEDSSFVTGYTVTATPSGGTATTFDIAGNEQSLAATGLAPGVIYSFSVTAHNDQGDGHEVQSATSSAITAVPSAATLAVATPSTVAEGSDFTVSVMSSLPGGGTSPIVSWQLAWDDGLATDVQSGTSGSDVHTPATGVGEVTAFVTAMDAAGHSFTLPPESIIVVPAAPTAVTAVAQTETDILVSWQTATLVTSSSVVVLRSDDGGATYAAIATVDAGTTSYDDAELTASTAYHYEVESQATDGDTTSAPVSPTSTSTPTATPSDNVSLTASGNGVWDQVELAWHYAGGDASGFELEMKDVASGENYHLYNIYGHPDAGGNGLDTVGVTPGQWDFRIRADKVDGTVSDYSETQWTVATATAGSATATMLQVSDGSGGTTPSLQLSVSGLPPAGGVAIEVRGDAYPGGQWHLVNDGEDNAWPLGSPDETGAELTLFDPGVTVAGGNYEYRVQGSEPDGQPTDWSTATSATFPNTTTGPRAFSLEV